MSPDLQNVVHTHTAKYLYSGKQNALSPATAPDQALIASALKLVTKRTKVVFPDKLKAWPHDKHKLWTQITAALGLFPAMSQQIDTSQRNLRTTEAQVLSSTPGKSFAPSTHL
jgi:hypothetical protein